ncbi:hypothetical protein SLEP1_g741 [Rubroshorea leprosula]|uniref:RPM1 interacting protein 13 n=1 Tax=Rubroshorea leprosula TaxID=152421 RepID=A0AAV5HGA5_9ROSI|nr:hypothetical protein SLEP1_g741 [Rubroshorea leprosula]
MDPNQPVLDISSDEEPPLDEPKRADSDLSSEFLFDDPDEVMFVREVKPSKRSKPKSRDVDDDDDDELVVLDGDPDKPLEVANEGDGGGDELMVVGQKGEIACRDLPHSRHLCANFKFSSTPHEKHCELCHCFVCDTRAPCLYWGSGTSSADHCHATDKEERWNSLRKKMRLSKDARVPVSDFHVASLPMAAAQLNNAPCDIIRLPLHSTPQNQVTMPIAQNQMRPDFHNQLSMLMLQNRVSRTNVQNQFSRPVRQNQVSRGIPQNQVLRPNLQNRVSRPILQNQVSRPNLQNQVSRPIMQNQVSRPMVQNQGSRPIKNPLGNSILQSQFSRPSIIRTCSSSNRNNTPSNISQPRSQQSQQISELGSNRIHLPSLPRSQHLLGPCNTAIRKDRGHGINRGSQFISSNTVTERVNSGVAAAVNQTACGSSESIAPIYTAQHAQNSAAVATENDRNPIGWQNFGSGTNLETVMLQSSLQPNMGSTYTHTTPSQPALYSQPIPQSNGDQCINQFGSCFQPATNGSTDFDFGLVSGISQSVQQSPITNVQQQTTNELSIKDLDDCTRFLFDDNLPFPDSDFLFFGNQSFPVVQDGCMSPEPPEAVSFDAGMRLFDFEPLRMA